MSWRSFPSWTPAALRRHAVLLVEWLRLANELKRLRADWTTRSTLLAVAAIALTAAALMFFFGRLGSGIKVLNDYWLLTAVVTAVISASSVARRRRRFQELHLQSWLVSAPIPQASVRASQMVRALLPTFPFLVGATLLMLVDVVVAAATAAGLIVGMIAGCRAGARRPESRTPASHYVRAKRAGTQALSAWPVSQVLAWSRPENSRYVLIVALFAVQGGSSAIIGLSVVGLYFVGSYLAALLSALLRVAQSASVWLRSTPMALSEFVWLLSRRALIHQVLGTAAAGAFMVLLGAPLMLTLQIAAIWLSLVISASGCALIDCYRGRSPVTKLVMCVVVWTTVLALLQMRSAERA